jgi:hypothetical protein
MMRVKMMIFAAGKRRCGDPDRGGRFVRHHILYVYQIFLSLSLTPIKRLKVRPFVDTAFSPPRVYCVSIARKEKRTTRGCVQMRLFKIF